MRSKILRATGRTFRSSRKKLEIKLWLYKLLGWKMEGNFSWEHEEKKIITFHEVIKW